MEGITLKSLLAIPAVSGLAYNDVLSLLSLGGCSLMLLAALFGARLRRLGELGEWGLAPLVFGSLFQVSFLIMEMASESETIGFIFPMSPGMVNGLFVMSFLLLVCRWWLQRSPRVIVEKLY